MTLSQTTTEPAYQAFLQAYPAYASTLALDELRKTEYSRLDRTGQVYLDYTGGGLYAESQLHQHMDLLAQNVFGNPHSNNPTSQAMTCLVDQTRAYILEYFNASPEEYVAIFTQNASGALKLVGESYPFGPGDHYLLTFDNHNSVNGIREFARHKGAAFTYLPVIAPELRLDLDQVDRYLDLARPGANNLFAFPAQSNFSGVQHPLELIARARTKGWDVLVDAAAYVPTNRFDLTLWQPDFVPLSFYKMFGYPTGLGCLLARRTALAKLIRPWYAGGTITISSVQGDGYYLVPGEAGFEDGTINYLNIPAVEIGLRYLQSIGIDLIHERVTCLTGYLIDQLMAMRHSSGQPLVRLHGPASTHARGGTVTVNFYDCNGLPFDVSRIEELANLAGISLRTGCFCNPGAGEIVNGLTPEVLKPIFLGKTAWSYQEMRQNMCDHLGKEILAVRLSVGLASNFADVEALLHFASEFIDKTSEEVGGQSGDRPLCSTNRDAA